MSLAIPFIDWFAKRHELQIAREQQLKGQSSEDDEVKKLEIRTRTQWDEMLERHARERESLVGPDRQSDEVKQVAETQLEEIQACLMGTDTESSFDGVEESKDDDEILKILNEKITLEGSVKCLDTEEGIDGGDSEINVSDLAESSDDGWVMTGDD